MKNVWVKNAAHRQQKNRKDKFHPFCGNGERLGFRDKASRCCARNATDNFPAALRIARAAILFFGCALRRQIVRRLRGTRWIWKSEICDFWGSQAAGLFISAACRDANEPAATVFMCMFPASCRKLQASGLCSPEMSALRAAHVGAGAGVDFDRFAFLNEKRHVNGLAGFELCRLGDVTGSVAAQTFR